MLSVGSYKKKCYCCRYVKYVDLDLFVPRVKNDKYLKINAKLVMY